MKRVIWKYPIAIDGKGEFSCEMPLGAEVVCVRVVEGTPCLYASVNPDKEPDRRNYKVLPTGIPFASEGMFYIGTFSVLIEKKEPGQAAYNTEGIFHVFEVM